MNIQEAIDFLNRARIRELTNKEIKMVKEIARLKKDNAELKAEANRLAIILNGG